MCERGSVWLQLCKIEGVCGYVCMYERVRVSVGTLYACVTAVIDVYNGVACMAEGVHVCLYVREGDRESVCMCVYGCVHALER